MNIRDIDLNLLVFFDALMRERSVSRAAQQLGLSQPALSNALGRLREQLDDPLFIRSSHGMNPTEKALDLYEPVQQAIEQLREALSPSKPFDPSKSEQSFTIACMDAIEYPLLSAVAQRLQERAPNISLKLVIPPVNSYEMLERGLLDLQIPVFEETKGDSLHVRTLMKDDLVCICRDDHPLIKQYGELTLEAYLAYPHLRVTRTGVGASPSDVELQKLGKQRAVQIESRQSAFMPVYMVLDSDLIATIPRGTAQSVLKYLPIKIFEPPFQLPRFGIEMGWGAIMQHNKGHQWLRNLIVEVAEEVYV